MIKGPILQVDIIIRIYEAKAEKNKGKMTN